MPWIAPVAERRSNEVRKRDGAAKEPEVGAMMAECIRRDRDCADACRCAALLMGRGSPFAAEFCELCAKFCEACAAECEKHEACLLYTSDAADE